MKDARTLELFERPRRQPAAVPPPTRPPQNALERARQIRYLSGEPEHMPTTQAVRAYLRERGFDVHTYCKLELFCDIWRVEELLLKDLDEARGRGDAVQTHQLRGMIRAVSWLTHDRPETDILISQLQTYLKKELGAQDRHKRRLEQAEARDVAREVEGDMRVLERDGRGVLLALTKPALDEEAEAAVETMEYWLANQWHVLAALMKKYQLTWDKLDELIGYVLTGEAHLDLASHPTSFRKDLHMPPEDADRLADAIMIVQQLRPIRDQLYHQRLYPRWYRLGDRI